MNGLSTVGSLNPPTIHGFVRGGTPKLYSNAVTGQLLCPVPMPNTWADQ